MSTPTGKVVWIINHYAGSRVHGMEYRHYYLARHFHRMGHRSVIVAASFHHLLTKLPETPTTDVDGVPYVWIKTRRYEGNGVRRALNMVDFSVRLAARSLRDLPRPDVVIASSPHPFAAFNGSRLAGRYGARFLFEVRDLWPLTLLEVGGHSPRHPFVRAMAWAERLGYKRSDHTVSLLAGAKDYMVAHGLDAQKFVHIPNGFDPGASLESSEPLPAEHDRVIQEMKARGQRIILYSGSHGMVNALKALVEAAALVRDESGVGFLLVGQGPEKESLWRQVREAGLTNITFLPPVKRTQMPGLTHAADAGYIGLQKKDLFKYGVSPNKLFEYMSAGLPVLFAVDTTFDEVAEAQCGFSVPAEDSSALAGAVRRMIQMPPDTLAEMGERGRQHVLGTHTYQALAERYASLF